MSYKNLMPKKLDKKYARMWNEACGWEIPHGIKPFRSNGRLSERESMLYSEACWMVLNMMCRDGLISQAELRHYHEKKTGNKKGWSKIIGGARP